MKRPYIESRQMYMATDFACKMIHNKEPRLRSIKTAANYYGVDEKELTTHVNEMQAYKQHKRVSRPVPDWEDHTRKCSKCGTVSYRKWDTPCPFCFYREKP